MAVFTRSDSSSAPCGAWHRRFWTALRILAGFEIALILATWPLWWRNHSFPVIPLLQGFSLPVIADRIAVCILLVACLVVASSSERSYWSTTAQRISLVAALILCVGNQQCLQAWHWLFILGLGTAFFRAEDRLRLLRSILASVYVCSALSRMAPHPYQGISAAIVDQLIRMTRVGSPLAHKEAAEFVCHALNLAELAVGLLLIRPASRRYGILAAMGLHLTLLFALGPFGLRHHTGVLIWNICFLCLIPVAFFGPVSASVSGRTGQPWFYRVATLFVWVFPLSGLIGIADNWPAWQLYSTRPELWTLQVHETDIKSLGPGILPYVSEPAPLDDWATVRLDRWSLDETGSPMYPEDRFQCAVISNIVERLPADTEFRIEISAPERWLWWRRVHRSVRTRAELHSQCRP
ncbi:MAG: hypothetical protein KDB01_13865 [Planctomycetaceae bacterium]|nr:hypothetical protein [Planctomycetaceae bacterium]